MCSFVNKTRRCRTDGALERVRLGKGGVTGEI